ncbi:gluconokinase, GntK/IdnK-type [Colwellia sp. MSW7]|uniref:Gluconokinase n=1 Tax=Colwellia maritima TaxID=2912588 RepID=A0ABS9WYP5_9GAMM|nr:gluconokinase, GntK/IdnK-type [Colwellia maritima]MCI2283060.1 gluconokinase, GntK/IdnK-type [Colwellia maritima]
MTRLSNEKQQNIDKLSLYIVMGVSGSGKSVIGEKLAQYLSNQIKVEFIDADDFHSPQAKQRMAANLPLDDTMRKPWVNAIMNKLMELASQNKNVVLAFSGLKLKHRNCLRSLSFNTVFYYLQADMNIIRTRMLNRNNHFFKPELLTSQFLAMEAVSDDEQNLTTIDVSGSLDEVYQTSYHTCSANTVKVLI